MRPAVLNGAGGICFADRVDAAELLRAVLNTACDPQRARRESLGYYLSPGTRTWDRMIELEALLSGEQHAIVSRRRWLDHGMPGSGVDPDPKWRSICDQWSDAVAGKTLRVVVTDAISGTAEATLLTRLGAWGVLDCGDGSYSLTWGPLGMAAFTGSLEEMHQHLAALGELRDHSDPGFDGSPGSSALALLRRRGEAVRGAAQVVTERGGA